MREQELLSQRSFHELDQKRFAEISGDSNPMHVDAVVARRTEAGAPIVHGIHLLLWVLECLACTRPNLPPLRTLRVRFDKFVHVGQLVAANLVQINASGAHAVVCIGKVLFSQIQITFGEAKEHGGNLPETFNTVHVPSAALELMLDEIADRSGKLIFSIPAEIIAAMFPAVTAWLSSRRVAALAASSTLVGMVCPGLHSIYSALSLDTREPIATDDALYFGPAVVDPRFRFVRYHAHGGGWAGTIDSFVRMPPQVQPNIQALKGLVAEDAFAGSIVLVVGGSRGLGELTAKLTALGGARVIVTYSVGEADAKRVAQEITNAGGTCEVLRFDVRKPVDEQLAALAEAPTHVYYFATPKIFRSGAAIFNTVRFNEFLDIYVAGFWRLAQSLIRCRPDVSIFYPSTVSVQERPRQMTEYAMAKIAGEVLCADMNVSIPPIRVTVNRLPRLLTDQTATVTPVSTASSIDILLPIVIDIQSSLRREI